jgi:HemY protein
MRHWADAETALALAVSHRAIDPVVGRQHKAAILLARSGEEEAEGKTEAALESARAAHAADPIFVPAAVRLARLLVRADKARRARRMIEETWAKNPHSDLLAPYREACGIPDALRWAQGVQRLVEANRTHVESRLALAEAALGAQLWGVARQELVKLVPARPADVTADVPSQACRLQATLEERENANADLGRRWRAAATTAAGPDSVWQCDGCGAVLRAWMATCVQCAAFNRFSWRVPAGHATGAAAPTNAQPAASVRLVGVDFAQRALRRGAG